MNSYTLIHTAFFAEAKAVIEHFGMRCLQKKPYRLYKSEKLLLIVSGMGAKNALHVEAVLKDFKITKAINIGIAGCKNRDIKIGSLFCTNKTLPDIDFATITSVSKPLDDKNRLDTCLVDMEAQSFLEICKKELDEDFIFVFKVVSDYLDTSIPKKEFVEELIKNSIKKWEKYV